MNVGFDIITPTNWFTLGKEKKEEISNERQVTEASMVCVEQVDLVAAIENNSSVILRFLNRKHGMLSSVYRLISDIHRTSMFLKDSLKLLYNYKLVNLLKEPNLNKKHELDKIV